ncbi:DUF805 domain-containing protein [Maribacter sp.]|uniref:DUF805 domain-containing protein n=1 Tax=Maribacter sp. TaxID=1897614 RepID=UPI0025C50988|nr:DUF805 domain-containing protein [Maribacter sp.]
MEWFLMVLKKYAEFTGRSRRKEYWMFVLISTIISYLLYAVDYFALGFEGYGINTLYSLGVFIPSLAVLVRRLHDVGKSGWFFFIILIPIIGVIWLLVVLCTDSEDGDNKYGVNPKNPNSELNDIGVSES